ncbi:hypothetical protein FS837_012532 [Tulasnella sp. UAMH 9824]|nr:hypothetical protein FS837_012532 [Tulasnella sp. UAMH 9824]
MAPLTPQKRTRFSPTPNGVFKKARYAKNHSNSDGSGSPTVSSDDDSGRSQAYQRKPRPAPLTPKKSVDALSRFNDLQIATPSSSRFAQHPAGIQASHTALEIDEALGMETGDESDAEADEAEEREVTNTVLNAHSDSDVEVQSDIEEVRDVMVAIREYIYPPPFYRFKHGMVDREAYGPEQAIMEGETANDDDNASDKAVRLLNHFIFYLDTARQLCALGEVSPKIDEDEFGDAESDTSDIQEATPIYLGPILDAYQGDPTLYTK